jgi:hypothetical protein
MHRIDAVLKRLSRLYELNRQIRSFKFTDDREAAGSEKEAAQTRETLSEETTENASTTSPQSPVPSQ